MDIRWFGGGILLLGLATLMFGIWFIYSHERATGWRTVEGKIEQVDIRRYHPQVQTGLNKEQRERYVEYYPKIHYRWQVDGTNFRGSRYRLGQDFQRAKSEADARALAADFIPGMPLKVHYDPKNPASAVLDTRSDWAARRAPLLLGLLFTAIGLALWIWAAPINAALRNSSPVDLS